MPQNWDKRRVETDDKFCPECGAQVEGGRGGCQAKFDELAYMMGTHPQIAAVHQLALDAYCMQHVESYCESAKSYAAHLVGLYWRMEHPEDLDVFRPIQRVLALGNALTKPPVLEDRGATTFPQIMAEYHKTGDIDALIRRIQAWVDEVWEAYGSQHEIARKWLGEI